MSGINHANWLFNGDPKGPSHTPDYLKGWVDAGFTKARLPVDVAPVLSGAMPASTLGFYIGQAAKRLLAAGNTGVIVSLMPNSYAGFSADAICNNPITLKAYRDMAVGVVHKMQLDGVSLSVSVELMNEPQLWGDGGPATDTIRSSWGAIQQKLHAACRVADPNRVLYICPPCGALCFGLPYLDLTPYLAEIATGLTRVYVHHYDLGDKNRWDGVATWPRQVGSLVPDLARLVGWCAQWGIPLSAVSITEHGVTRSLDGSCGGSDADAAQCLADYTAAFQVLGITDTYLYAASPFDFVGGGKAAYSIAEKDGSGRLEPALLFAIGLAA